MPARQNQPKKGQGQWALGYREPLNPNERMLIAFEKQMAALGHAIQRAVERDDWRARPSPFCMSCSFQDRCPAWAESNRAAP